MDEYNNQFYLPYNFLEVSPDSTSTLLYGYNHDNSNSNTDYTNQPQFQSQNFPPTQPLYAPPPPVPGQVPFLEYISRRLEHHGPPITSIGFYINGNPGIPPLLHHLAPPNESKSPVLVDNPHDPVFPSTDPRVVMVDFDFPGSHLPYQQRFRIPTHLRGRGLPGSTTSDFSRPTTSRSRSGSINTTSRTQGPTTPATRAKHQTQTIQTPITRQYLAQKLAERILMTIAGAKADLKKGVTEPRFGHIDESECLDPRWRLENVKTRSIRLCSLWCFDGYWVPVLAVDA